MAACKKKGDNQNLEDTNTPVSDYMSTKAGSWWLYSTDDGHYVKRVATGKDSLKMDLVFNYYEATDSSTGHVTPEYFGKNGDKYLMLIDIDGNETNYLQAIIQKDNAQVGDTWTNTASVSYSGISFDLLTEGEVISVNGTLMLNGHLYSQVTEVKNTLKGKLSSTPVYTNCGTVTMWFVKGIGVLRSNFDINILSFYQKHYEHSLVDYHIAP